MPTPCTQRIHDEQPANFWLAAAIASAVLVYDPQAPGIAAKRTLLLFLGLVALALTAPRIWSRRKGQRLPLATALWLAWCGWCGLSTLWASHPRYELLMTWVGGAAVALGLAPRDRRGLRYLAGLCAALIGTGSALICLIQTALGARGIAIHGGHGNPNWLGLVLACALPLQLDLSLRLRRLRRPAWRWALITAGLSIPALFFANSRVAWFALLITATVFARGRWRWLSLAAVAVGLGSSLVASHAVTVAWAGRWWIWRAAAAAAVEGGFSGQGLGDFPWAFLTAQGKLLSELDVSQAARGFVNATSAHNDWLEALVQTGPLGTLLLLASFGVAIAHLRKHWRAGAACVLVVAMCALGDTPLRQAGVVALLMLVFAATEKTGTKSLAAAARLTALGASVVLLTLAASSWLGHRLQTKARDAPLAQRIELLTRAAQLDPRSGQTALQLGLSWLELNEPHKALPALQRSRPLLANLGTDIAIGNALLRLDDTPRAIEAYQRALRRHPGYFRAHANLTEALRRAGRLTQAQRHLQIARKLQPGHPKLAKIAERLRTAIIDRDVGENSKSAP